MEQIVEEIVVRNWHRVLHREDAPQDYTTVKQQLIQAAPAKTRILWGPDRVTWYRVNLGPDEFKSLYLNRVSQIVDFDGQISDEQIWKVANQIYDERTIDTGSEAIQSLFELATEFPFQRPGPIIISTRRGCSKRRILRGEQLTVATALAMRYGNQYEPLVGYLGVTENPIHKPIIERSCGKIKRAVETISKHLS